MKTATFVAPSSVVGMLLLQDAAEAPAAAGEGGEGAAPAADVPID